MPVVELSDDDRALLHAIYEAFVAQGRRPIVPELALAAERTEAGVEAALHRLSDAHLLVLEQGSEQVAIEMALPFSGVPRPHCVRVGDRSYFANCAWDTFGILAIAGGSGVIASSCPDCDDPMAIEVTGGHVAGEGLVHFVVPAKNWWQDIRFT